MKLLIVDDEPIILSNIKNIITQSEFKDLEILTANNAAEAYDVINSNSPEIILTDIQMPQENGIHLLIKISELNYSPIVIFITGYSDFSYMQSALRYKAFDYLLKPITDTALIPCLKKRSTTGKRKNICRNCPPSCQISTKKTSRQLKNRFLKIC